MLSVASEPSAKRDAMAALRLRFLIPIDFTQAGAERERCEPRLAALRDAPTGRQLFAEEIEVRRLLQSRSGLR